MVARIILLLLFISNFSFSQAEIHWSPGRDSLALGDSIKYMHLIGRKTSGYGGIDQIRIGSGLTVAGDSISASGGGGSASIDSFFYRGDTVYASVTGDGVAMKYAVLTKSIINPSQLTSDQDDYNPSGFDAANIIKISGDNGLRAITGLAPQSDGEEKKFINTGTYPIYFTGENTGSTASYRIKCNKDIFLYPCQTAILTYDTIADRWFIFKTTDGENPKELKIRSPLYSITAADYSEWGFTTATGTIGQQTSSSNTFAGMYIGGSANTQYEICYHLKTGLFTYFGNAHIYTNSSINIPTLSDATDTYTYEYRICNSPTTGNTAINNSVGIRYTHGTNSGKFLGFSKDNGGTETTLDLGITVATNTNYDLRIEIDKARSEVHYYIDGVAVGRIYANLPNAATATASHIFYKSAGTNPRQVTIQDFITAAIYP
ncbi:MAG: hypothetical protein IPG12_14135 [Saprospiraceae bacterium]|nr:hypothetical protein [Saprospiraceae bacterium]